MNKKKAEYVSNGLINVPNITVDYKGYKITPKRDFGKQEWLVNGNTIRKGYIVINNGCNIMPAATWFISIIEAKVGVDTLIESKKTDKDFWKLFREKQGLNEWEEV